jgi:hypothetical protein
VLQFTAAVGTQIRGSRSRPRRPTVACNNPDMSKKGNKESCAAAASHTAALSGQLVEGGGICCDCPLTPAAARIGCFPISRCDCAATVCQHFSPACAAGWFLFGSCECHSSTTGSASVETRARDCITRDAHPALCMSTRQQQQQQQQDLSA